MLHCDYLWSFHFFMMVDYVLLVVGQIKLNMWAPLMFRALFSSYWCFPVGKKWKKIFFFETTTGICTLIYSCIWEGTWNLSVVWFYGISMQTQCEWIGSLKTRCFILQLYFFSLLMVFCSLMAKEPEEKVDSKAQMAAPPPTLQPTALLDR